MSDHSEWLFRLDDILEHIDRAQSFLDEVDYGAFIKNQMIIYAVERCVLIIGEAANQIPVEIRDGNSDIPWHKIIGMRNRLVHNYGGVDLGLLWDVVTEEIYELERMILDMKEKYEGAKE